MGKIPERRGDIFPVPLRPPVYGGAIFFALSTLLFALLWIVSNFSVVITETHRTEHFFKSRSQAVALFFVDFVNKKSILIYHQQH